MNKATHIFKQIIYFRKVILGLVAILVGLSLYTVIENRQIDNSLEIWFLDDDPYYQHYLKYQKEQGSDEIIVMMVSVGDSLEVSDMERLIAFQKDVDSLPYVRTSMSLATAKYPYVNLKGIDVKEVFSKERGVDFYKIDEANFLSNYLISKEKDQLFIYIQLGPTSDIEPYRAQIIPEVRTRANSHFQEYAISGSPLLTEGSNQSVATETNLFAVVTIVFVAIFLFFLLPDRRYIPLALAAIGLPVILLFGLMFGLGIPLNMISMIIPSVLMVYGLSDIVHVINIYARHLKTSATGDRIDDIAIGLTKSLKPCFYTTISTMAGYFALYFSTLPALRITGVFAFIGLLFAFTLVYVISAIGFYYLGFKPRAEKQSGLRLSSVISWVNNLSTVYPKAIITIAILVVALGSYSISNLQVSTNMLNYIKAGPYKSQYYAIENATNGLMRFDISVESKDGKDVTNPKTIKQIGLFQDELVQRNLMLDPVSLVNFQRYLEKAGKRYFAFNPSLRSKIRRELEEMRKEDAAYFSFHNESRTSMNIISKKKLMGTYEARTINDQIFTTFKETVPEKLGLDLKVNGYLPLYIKLNDYILKSQFLSFGAALVLAFVILLIFVKDIKTATLALLPNILPLFLIGLVMTLFGLHIDASTAMLAPIMIGIAMDDTIHLIHHYQVFRSRGKNVAESMKEAMQVSGRAIFSTSLTLVIGFAIIGLSGLNSISIFGLLCSATVLFAFVSDAILLPALLKFFD